MARCGFCHREFKSSQSVRAHLRFCRVYQSTPRTPSAPPRARRATTNEEHLRRLFGPAIPTRQTQLTRQELEPRPAAAHPVPVRHSGWSREQIRQEVRRQWQALEEEERQAGAAQQARATRIRARVQDVKFCVIDLHSPWPPVPSAAIAEAKEAIEQKLLTLPLLELPLTELQQIGTGLRDTIYARYRAPAAAAPVPSTSLITSNPLPTQEVTMPKQRVLSGYFICPLCDEEFELDREPEKDARCEDCGVPLEELAEDEEDDDVD